MANALPKIKKKINAFLLGEDGKISKASVVSTGVLLLGATSLILNSKLADAAHVNNIAVAGNCLTHVSHDSY